MPLALLLHLYPMRLAVHNEEKNFTTEQIIRAAVAFCNRHNFTYPGDEQVRSAYNAIKLPSLRRELGVF